MTSMIRTLGMTFSSDPAGLNSFFESWFDELPEELWPEYFCAAEDTENYTFPARDASPLISYVEGHRLFPMIERDSQIEFFLMPVMDKTKPSAFSLTIEVPPSSDLVGKMFDFLVQATQPNFAYLVLEADWYDRHRFSVEITPRGATATGNVGLGMDETLPGVYFRTYISHQTVADYSLSIDDATDAYDIEQSEGGYWLTAYEDGDRSGTDEARRIEKSIEDQLNSAAFYQPEQVSRDELREKWRIG